MSSPVQVREFHALILDPKQKSILLMKQSEQGWLVPRIRVTSDNDRMGKLIDYVRSVTGLDVDVIGEVGPQKIAETDGISAIRCEVVGGEIMSVSATGTQLKWFTANELRPSADYDEIGDTVRSLGTVGRMIWDGLSILEEGAGPDWDTTPSTHVRLSDNECFLVQFTGTERLSWQRLDPYSPSGYMGQFLQPA